MSVFTALNNTKKERKKEKLTLPHMGKNFIS